MGIWVENKGYRKLLKALSCGCSPGLLHGCSRAALGGSEGSGLAFELGSCSVCVCVRAGRCQLWDYRCFCSPLWVPGAAWLCPSPAASSLVSVITWLLQLLFLSTEGTFVSQAMAPECGSSGSAEELLFCSSRALQQLLRLQDPNLCWPQAGGGAE